MGELALDMRGIAKRFPGVHALRGVDISVAPGEILGLVGENGAGKSTLVKILAGADHRDAGEIRIGGVPVGSATPQHMIDRGVAVIYQEPALAPHLTTAENVFLGALPRNRWGIVDWRKLAADTVALSERLGLDLRPQTPVGQLSVARRQMVEIAKALSRDARLIVLDEPSAVLGDAELRGLFDVMRKLADRGVALIYISHRLDEVFHVADRVTVMKDGQVVATRPSSELTADRLVQLMVGRDIAGGEVRGPARLGDEVLAVRGLRRRGVLDDVSLSVRAGEIVGLAGLAGAGRTEVLRAIHGADPIDAGSIEVCGAPVRIRSPRDAIALGIGLLTEDRQTDGLMTKQTVGFNATIVRLAGLARRGVLSRARERRTVDGYVARLQIRTTGATAGVRNLSGGNQQKVILAKWLHADCRILLVDEPTRGVDVGAKREIWRILVELAERGTAILLVSSDLPEVLALCDRIVVMREGRVTAELDRAQASEETVLRHATTH